MNYKKHYNLLIERARNRVLDCYTERHHVMPKCMGGSNDADNLVDLTAEEHYVAHQLLVKMYPGVRGLIYAANQMTGNAHGHRSNNKSYGWLRRKCSEVMKGDTYEERYGKERATIIKRNRSKALKGKPKSKAHKKALVEAWKRRVITDEARRKMSESGKRTSQNKSARRKRAEKMASEWLITDPQGKTVKIKNLRKYCRDNSLPTQSVYKGFRGWKSVKLEA